MRLPSALDGLLEVFLFPARDDHAGAEARELLRDGEADAGRAAGDDAGAPVECFVGKHARTL
jgi:hypothetical protein